jgi:SAM-dependent methyltransferase
VDLVGDVENLPQADASAGTIIAMNTFEHVPRFWRGFEQIRRVLRPDGALLVSCPFHFKIHHFPGDYWRFTPDALELLLEDYPSKIIGWHGAMNRPAHVWALAFREGRPAISAAQFEHYRRLMKQYARQPLGWGRRLRYKVGSWLFGRRPFSSILDQERWESVCRTTPVQSFRVPCPTGSPSVDFRQQSKSPSASPTGIAESCCADA